MTIVSTDRDNGFAFSSESESAYITSGVAVHTVLVYYKSDFLTNQGIIFGYDGIDIIDAELCTIVNNSGATITGANNGISALNSSADSDFLKCTNYGTISAQDALYIASNHSTLFNFGMMTGTQDAVFVSGTDSYINNSGRISGRQTAVNASAGSATVIRNSGILDGDVLLGSGVNKVVNTGTILGDVSLGNGGSLFNGHGGTVTGSITGGTGADTIRAGNDGETLAGGKGHDTLFGGTGADTFAFSSFAAADSDTIRGFNVGLDTIQLDHAVFTRLQADATPSFSVGTSASAPTNYLFYNPTSGVLFYDTDGNGSRAPLAVATLAPNLNLTAGNFSVV